MCATFAADVTSEAEVKAMVDACMDAFGRVDILHNNVGGQDRDGGCWISSGTTGMPCWPVT